MRAWQIFLSLSCIGCLIAFAKQNLFFSDLLFYQIFDERFTTEQIDLAFSVFLNWKLVGYALIPFYILLRVFFTAAFLYVGIFFFDIRVEISKLLRITLLADFVFLLSSLTALIILIFFKQVSTLEDLQFTPLSVIEFLDYESIEPLFIYPLSLLNVFELLYVIVIAWLLVGVINETNQERPVNFGKSLKLVTASYGSGLFLWVVFVMFISLNLT